MRFSELRPLSVSSKLTVFVAATLLFAVPALSQQAAPAPVSEVVLTLDPAQSRVHWTLDTTLHTVHGTFVLKSGTMHFDPETGKASGQIIVSTASGESGNHARDARMHKDILETAKAPEASFRPAQIEGKVVATGTSDVKLSGVFTIHGTDHDLTAQIHAEFSEHTWTGTAKFDVPYVAWGIKDPSNFLLKVKPVVNVELDMSGEIKSGEAKAAK
jgi:polyisoprenoid-binding protein YceI